MQEFAADPTDADLAVLLDAGGRAVSLRVQDTPDVLTVGPFGHPRWFSACCVFPPGVGLVVGLAHLTDGAVFGPLGWAAILAIGVAFGCLCAFAVELGVYAANRKMLGPGAFFILDRARRTLTLPRRGVVLRAAQIRGFVTVRAWHTERHDDENTTITWVVELSVLAHGERGGLVRHPVATCVRTGKVDGVAAMVAEFFGVEHRALRLDRRARRRLRADAAGRA